MLARVKRVHLLVAIGLAMLILLAVLLAQEHTNSGVSHDPYGDLLDWTHTNGAYLNGADFVRAAEFADRQTAMLDVPGERSSSGGGGETGEAFGSREDIEAFQASYLEYILARHQLEGVAREEPFNLDLHETIYLDFQGAAYSIEVFTWDAYPGFPVPANIYRPVGSQGRLPLIITPLGCNSNLASHNDASSTQRRAANLALRGFVVFVMGSGACQNGLVGSNLDNSYVFEQYGRLSGSGLSSISIELLMYVRALDMLAARNDVDMSRVGVTGYSHGGGISLYLAAVDERVAALALVATNVSSVAQMDADNLFVDKRSAAVYAAGGLPDIFVYSNMPPLVDFTASEAGQHSPPPLVAPDGWQSAEKFVMLAPRPFLLVQGREDEGTSVSGSRALVGQLESLYLVLDPVALPPELLIVDGAHNYNAQRRRLAADWLAEVLDAQAVVPPLTDMVEYRTPILEIETLERMPRIPGDFSLRDIHVARALTTINEQRELHPFGTRDADEAREFLRRLLLMPVGTQEQAARPIMLDEKGFVLGEIAVSARFWLLPLSMHLTGAALTITPEGEAVNEVAFYVSASEELVPSEDELITHLQAGRSIAVVYLPGFRPLIPTQETLGNLAINMPDELDRTLLGVGVEATQAALDLTDALYPGARVIASSVGVDAGNVLAFATALDERIGEAHLYSAVDTFLDFLEAPGHPIPAPTMAIPGLAAYVDIADVKELAGESRILVESESALSEYVLDLR